MKSRVQHLSGAPGQPGAAQCHPVRLRPGQWLPLVFATADTAAPCALPVVGVSFATTDTAAPWLATGARDLSATGAQVESPALSPP